MNHSMKKLTVLAVTIMLLGTTGCAGFFRSGHGGGHGGGQGSRFVENQLASDEVISADKALDTQLIALLN